MTSKYDISQFDQSWCLKKLMHYFKYLKLKCKWEKKICYEIWKSFVFFALKHCSRGSTSNDISEMILRVVESVEHRQWEKLHCTELIQKETFFLFGSPLYTYSAHDIRPKSGKRSCKVAGCVDVWFRDGSCRMDTGFSPSYKQWLMAKRW